MSYRSYCNRKFTIEFGDDVLRLNGLKEAVSQELSTDIDGVLHIYARIRDGGKVRKVRLEDVGALLQTDDTDFEIYERTLNLLGLYEMSPDEDKKKVVERLRKTGLVKETFDPFTV